METANRNVITVSTTVDMPVEKAWEYWTKPEHITKWNFANDDWQCPRAENDPRTGGKFTARMEAKDGSMGFDFGGEYDEVRDNELISYTMGDGRKVNVRFIPDGDRTRVEEEFDAESTNPAEMQKAGWQAILDNYKKHAESSNGRES
jgi:uncharacterized protein YndB with AHSA1/START domain